MIEADRVHSTPPLNSSLIQEATSVPADSQDSFRMQPGIGQPESQTLTSESPKPAQGIGRRGLLIALAALPVALPAAAAAEPDPIFDVIEYHREVYAHMEAVFAEHRRAHEIADATVGPYEIEVPSMVEPGKTVLASCWLDIERAIPSKEYPDLYRHYNAVLDERKAARRAIIESLIDDEEKETDEVASAECEALDGFEETVPTTLRGLLEMVAYAGQINDENPDAWDRDSAIFASMAEAARTLLGRSV